LQKSLQGRSTVRAASATTHANTAASAEILPNARQRMLKEDASSQHECIASPSVHAMWGRSRAEEQKTPVTSQ